MSRTSLIPFIMVLFVGVMSPGFATTLSTIELEKAVHFLSLSGEDVVARPGTYTVEAVGNGLRLILTSGEPTDALVVEASPTQHSEKLSHPVALSLPGVNIPGPIRDLHIITLLLPDGKGVDAVGTYSGVRTRGIRANSFPRVLNNQQLKQVKVMARQLLTPSSSSASQRQWTALIRELKARNLLHSSRDVHALVQWVMRQTYLENISSLKHYAAKVRAFNEQKKRLRQELTRARQQSKSQGKDYIDSLEQKLATVGDDAQLANIDLQNSLQKLQQILQTMSNVSKMLHDTAMAIIRKIG